MRRRAAIALGSAAAIGIGAGATTAWWRGRVERAMPEPVSTRPSANLWTTAVVRPDGTPLSLDVFRGRPLLVNFWATWCVPCVTELPLLDRFHAAQRAAANGWQVIALAVDSAANVQRFLAGLSLALPVGLLDAGAYDLPRRLGNASGGLPFSIVHDAAGRIALRHLGAVDQTLLDTWVASLN